ncbi:adenylate/guanylate cyclase domain-containing protein [Saccharicrinis fermentans]|uniref:Putative transmembrane sensor domain protein n=1 Tax=Saccharicrinis fermentans DSM 9555 = JCM 21142 TaxID=869213 RepID=W7YAT0_9BACT|nr:adenylate/guanylate cyclase domain-containing protein [Saccharicrinis fermentans]GAF01461.1 putative transmembrane sensor domain protein [Saccharicrinis fermentans DSM 9555 = JCM 21142]
MDWTPVLRSKYSSSKVKYHLSYLLLTLIYWNVVIRIAIFVRVLGNKGDNIEGILTRGMEFVAGEVLLSSVVVSIFGILSWYVRRFVYPVLIRKYHIRRLAILVIFMDAIVFFGFAVMLGFAHYLVDRQLSPMEAFHALGRFLFNPTILFFLIVLSIGSYVNQLLYTLFHQIGFAKLGRVMMGYYQKPREENLIFMFLDLRSSTTFAEKLGHQKYSDFIQDCFRMLSEPLLLTYGRVYQYVGDEVVVTWNANKKDNFKKAVDFFFLYKSELERHREYFEQRYGLMPIFTASINSGRVMAAQVGEIKSELAFHGDVLNTAARIQKQCKKYGEEIIVTKEFAEHMNVDSNGYEVQFIDRTILAGKSNEVELYGVNVKLDIQLR